MTVSCEDWETVRWTKLNFWGLTLTNAQNFCPTQIGTILGLFPIPPKKGLPTWSNPICCSSEQEDGRSEVVGVQSGNKPSNKTAKFFYCGKGSTMRALTISLGTRAFANKYSNQSLSEHNFITLCNVSVLDTLYKTDNSRTLSYNLITRSLAERSVVRDSDYHKLKTISVGVDHIAGEATTWLGGQTGFHNHLTW